MRRRQFLGVLGGAAAWPLAAHAQQPSQMRRIGVLLAFAESDPEARVWIAAFREELEKLKWTEGRNIRIDARWRALAVAQRFASLGDAAHARKIRGTTICAARYV